MFWQHLDYIDLEHITMTGRASSQTYVRETDACRYIALRMQVEVAAIHVILAFKNTMMCKNSRPGLIRRGTNETQRAKTTREQHEIAYLCGSTGEQATGWVEFK